MASNQEEAKSFQDLGIVQELCDACSRIGWTTPTPIQKKAIPLTLKGHDVIGLAKTGSGKTAAYALPMLQHLLEKPRKLFGVVLTPTRELAFQVKEHIQALGTNFGVHVCVLTGGMDMKAEKQKLSSKPHIIVATPGRLLDHLKTTKGFSLDKIKYLIFDEADRILGVDLEEHMNAILRVLPKDRRTMLFSATMNKSAQKLEKASLANPILVKVNEMIQTVNTLQQYMRPVPLDGKIANLVWFLNDLGASDPSKRDQTFILFCLTRKIVLSVHITLLQLSFQSVPLYGKMPQNKRMAALNKFKRKERNILVATDVASRGLDIEGVDWVINYDLPSSAKDYIHRVGRTARAGKEGCSLTFCNQYDVMEFHKLEKKLQCKMKLYPIEDDEVAILAPSVHQARLNSVKEVEEMEATEMRQEAARSAKTGKRKPSGSDHQRKRKRV